MYLSRLFVAAEGINIDDRAFACLLGWRFLALGRRRLYIFGGRNDCLGLTGDGFECQGKVHRWVDKPGECRKWDMQMLGHAGKLQDNLKVCVTDFQIPILVLDNDGHIVWESFDKMIGDFYARRFGQECYVEMMVACWGTVFLCCLKNILHDPAHRGLR